MIGNYMKIAKMPLILTCVCVDKKLLRKTYGFQLFFQKSTNNCMFITITFNLPAHMLKGQHLILKFCNPQPIYVMLYSLSIKIFIELEKVVSSHVVATLVRCSNLGAENVQKMTQIVSRSGQDRSFAIRIGQLGQFKLG